MANLLGKNRILFFYDELSGGTGAYLPVGCLTSNGINRAADYTDGTKTKCKTDPEPIPNGLSYEIPFEAVAIEEDATKVTLERIESIMVESYEQNKPIFWKEVTKYSNDTEKTRFGKARLTELSDTAPVEGEVTFSGTLKGIGKISATDLKV